MSANHIPVQFSDRKRRAVDRLTRRLITCCGVAILLLMLLLFGPDVIFGLTICILLGTFIGTYSSIYISAPILVWLGVKPDSFLRATDDNAPVLKGGDGAVV